MLNLVAEISEMVGALSDVSAPIHLRKDNKIRSIHSSLAIENNTLSLEQVSAIIDGKKVLGLKREIDEVKKRLRLLRANLAAFAAQDFRLAESPCRNDERSCRKQRQF